MKLIFYVLLIFLYTVHSENGAKLALREEALNKTANAFLPFIRDQITKIHIDTQETKISGIKLTFFDIKLTAKIPDHSIEIKFVSPNMIEAHIYNLTAVINMQVTAKKWFVSETDECTITIRNFYATGAITLDREPSEISPYYIPLIVLDKISFNYDLEIEIEGGLIGNIINWFNDWVAKKIKETIQDNMKDNIIPKVNEGIETLVDKFLPILNLKNGVFLNLSIESDPFMPANNVFACGAFCQFTSTALLEKNNQTPVTSPDYDPLSNDLQAFLGESASNSGLEALFNLGKLTYTITSEMTEGLPIELYTDYFAYIFRDITKKYGSRDMNVTVSAKKTPQLTLLDRSVLLETAAKVQFFVVGFNPDGSNELVVELSSSIKLNLNGSIEFGKGAMEIEDLIFEEIKVDYATVEVKESLLNNLFKLASEIGVPIFNAKLMKIVLPSWELEGVVFDEFSIKFGENYCLLGSNSDPEKLIQTVLSDMRESK